MRYFCKIMCPRNFIIICTGVRVRIPFEDYNLQGALEDMKSSVVRCPIGGWGRGLAPGRGLDN